MSPLVKKVIVGISVLVVAYAATGRMLMGHNAEDKAYRALTVYSEVLEHIQHDYVDEPNMPAVTNGALHGLLDSLDPQSAYLSPLEYKDYKEKTASPATGESGMALTRRFGYIGVISVLPDSPAAKTGLRIGDILEKIAGFTTSQMAIDQAQTAAEGQSGHHREALRNSSRQSRTAGYDHHPREARARRSSSKIKSRATSPTCTSPNSRPAPPRRSAMTSRSSNRRARRN